MYVLIVCTRDFRASSPMHSLNWCCSEFKASKNHRSLSWNFDDKVDKRLYLQIYARFVESLTKNAHSAPCVRTSIFWLHREQTHVIMGLLALLRCAFSRAKVLKLASQPLHIYRYFIQCTASYLGGFNDSSLILDASDENYILSSKIVLRRT